MQHFQNTKKTENKPWCVDPFIQMAHTADGYYRVCCVGNVDKNLDPTTKDQTPLEYWNSDTAKQIRSDMLSHNFSPVTERNCKQCIMNAKYNIASRRTEENRLYYNTEKLQNNINKHINNIDYTYDDLEYVNFKVLGNVCNLKCIMCGPTASSKIAAEFKTIGKYDGDTILEPFTTDTREKYFEEINKIISSCNNFKLVGGENLIHPDFPQLFEIFYNNPNAKNLHLEIITNASSIPDIIYENAYKFKQLEMVVSIDGVGTKGSYIRSGLNWNNFDTNLRNLISNKDINVFLITATQMLNIGYLHEIHDYVVDIGADPKHVNYNNLVTFPKHFRAINLPKEIKKQYIDNLNNNDIINLPPKKLDEIKKVLNSEQDSHEDFLNGIKYLQYGDKLRNTNILKMYPEFEPYINENLNYNIIKRK